MNNYYRNNHSNFLHDTVSDYLESQNYFYKLNNDHLNIVQINMRSIRSFERFDVFKGLLDQFRKKLDVIIVSESWLDKFIFKYFNCLPEFEGFFDGRNYGSSGGGVAVFVKKYLKPRNLLLSNVNDFNTVWLEISNEQFGIMNIAAYYRPQWVDHLDLLNNLEEFMNKYSNKNCFIGGDMNINIIENNNLTNQYTNLLSSYGFHISNDIRTRYASDTLLDHAITNFSHVFNVINNTIDNDFSDHSIVMSEIYVPLQPESETFIKNYTDFELFRSNLSENLSNENDNSRDVNDLCNFITESLNSALIASSKDVIVHKRKKELLCPWINSEIKRLSNYKRNLMKKLKNCTLSTNKQLLKIRLNTISSVIISKKRILKQNYYLNLFNESKTSFQTWKNINSILSVNKISKSNVKGVTGVDNIYTEDSREMSENFNKYYTSITVDMSNRIISHINDDINHFNSLHRSENSIFLFPSTPVEVQNLIHKLNNNKSPGIDKISVKILKSCNTLIAPVISRLANLIFDSGSYPNALKIAKAIPIFKSGDSKLMINYRPISLLNILNKIIEQLLHNRLYSFLNHNDFFYKFQYGFRSKSSTGTATVELVDKILNALDKGEVVTGIFLDLAKAFDTVDHKILVKKLEIAGIRGTALNLFQNYLTDRMQCVFINGSYSSMRRVLCGVPQGSVLGPLLFLIYVNDLGALNLNCFPNLFADDTAMFYYNADVSVNINAGQQDLDVLQEYFRLNKLTLNVDKTKFINILSKSKILPPYPQLKFNGIPLGEVSEFKYLGIIFDKHLTWNSHIMKIRNTIACRVGILKKLSKFLSTKILLLLYYSLIHCHLEYLCLIWGSAANCHLRPLQVLQNRSLKFIFKLSYQHPSVDLYVSSKILPIKGIYCYQNCNFVKSVINNSKYHTIAFDFNIHDHDTRQSTDLYYGVSRNNFGKNKISTIGPCLYNHLPQELKNCEVNVFRCNLKRWLLEAMQLSKLTKFHLFF